MLQPSLVANRTVALVGNAPSLLNQFCGPEIDEHDVVIRINRGASLARNVADLGLRTTVWATARYYQDIEVPSDCAVILWMKLTKLGGRELDQLLRSRPPCDVTPWPPELEDEVKAFVGADPGTGIRLLYWLTKKCECKKVSVYGMDCWETGAPPTPNHKPDKERAAMRALGF